MSGRLLRSAMTSTDALDFWTNLLHLPGFVVVSVREDAPHGRYHFTVAPQHPIGVCPQCGKLGDTVKQRRNRDGIWDLPIGPHAVELTVRVEQYSCETCGQSFTPPTDFLAGGSHATERLLERAAGLIRHSDVANAARFYGIPEKSLERWYYEYVERLQRRAEAIPAGVIRRIGIDELSLKKSTGSLSP